MQLPEKAKTMDAPTNRLCDVFEEEVDKLTNDPNLRNNLKFKEILN